MLVAEKMIGFGVKIITYDPYVNKDLTAKYNVEVVDFDTLIERSDYISVHCPLTDDTRHMIDKDAFEKMKPSTIIINTARGAVIDEEALILALKENKIAAAGLDVLENEPVSPDNPLLFMENVIITPHNAWYSEEAVQTLQRMVGEEVVRVLSGNAPKNLVNRELLK